MRLIWIIPLLLSFWASPATGLSDVNKCLLEIHEKMKNPITQTVNGVVGIGWDDLTNKVTLPIFANEYKECQTTPDGSYLIPDNILAIPVQEVVIDRTASSYKRFQDISEDNIKTERNEGKFMFFGGGTYSEGQQTIKKYLSDRNTIMLESKIGYKAFTFIAREKEGLDEAFKDKIEEIVKSIEEEKPLLAQYQAELIIRDYGTHVVNKALTGAMISSKWFIDDKGETKNDAKMMKMSNDAAADFLGLFGGGSSGLSSNKDTSNSGYRNETRYCIIDTKGGPDVRRLLNAGNDVSVFL